MIITSKLNMDLQRPGPVPVIHAVQTDSYCRDLRITLLAQGAPARIPADARILIRYCKSDGTGGEYDTLPDGTQAWSFRENVLTVRLAPQVLTAGGRADLTVTVLTRDSQLSLFPIRIRIAPVAAAPVTESADYFYVTGFLPAPASAAAGEYLRVTAVDGRGRVTAVESAPLSGTGEEVPGYWLPALKAGARAINTALCTAGRNRSAFLFYSDAHWNYGARISPRLLKYLYRHTGITKTNFGGDIVSLEGTDYDTMAYLWDWRQSLKDLPNHHSVVGNHDDGNTTNNLFPEEYLYGYLLGPEETGDMVLGDSGAYYYIDCPCEQTRYLYLDTAWQGATEAQQRFVKTALTTAPEGWHLVAIAHIWHDTDYSVDPPAPAGINDQAQVFLTLFDSYNARSGDFSGCTGRVEFCIGGHTHWDYDSRSGGGIPIVLVETDSYAVRSGLTPVIGTTTEASVNGIVADYGTGLLHVIRIGRGESRDISLTDTGEDPGGSGDTGGDSGDTGDSGTDLPTGENNLLATAVDADGSLCPWKENVRWSGSSNAEVESAGTFLSGYFPYTPGQTVYLKNVNLPNVNGSGAIHYFSGLGTRVGGVHINDAVKYWSGAVDENNLVTRFTMFTDDSYAQVAWLRVECLGFDSTSVITVDNPIA